MLTLAMLELLRQRASICEFTDTPDPRALTAAAGTSTPVALPAGSTMAENLTGSEPEQGLSLADTGCQVAGTTFRRQPPGSVE